MEGVREVEINGENGAPARVEGGKGRGGEGMRKEGCRSDAMEETEDETREAKEECGGVHTDFRFEQGQR